ncbi:SRPBCC family protein [Mycobacterium asiaticum]|uniref:Polyketide cyclase n=1 Tax=Mycobacterium asiaticum TaxID=1790 RepID=A0A1A3KK47_MYCAS|nr:SRPBCC family protein [Mycobacterium asiaticum]OBJ55402.1 polyketide cyclase [Mycobacterium asiaticum]OBJ85390.1 polyketide cyclase [Mycobacterium asiaticum]ORA12937.1 MxaD family protein [Mycobacterium asiaticum DSM 44297]
MSGRKFSFGVNKTTSAPPATVFRLVTDGGNWSAWAKPIVVSSSWTRQGDPAPGGVGAIRKLGMWPVFVQEETIEYEQDRRHVYKLVGPRTPVNDYIAEVVLTPTPSGGTEISWSGSFVEKARGTGPAARAAMGGAVKFFAGKLVQAAEREAGTAR